LAVHFMDRKETTAPTDDSFPSVLRKKYLIILYEGGYLASLELKLPVASDDNQYIFDILSWIDEEIFFEVVISAVFLVIFLVTWCKRRLREQRQLRDQQERMRNLF